MGKFAFTLFVALFLPTIATADIVTRYDFARNVGSEPSESANLTAPNVTATPLTRGSGLVAASGGEKDMNSFASKGWAGPGTDDFLSLTITPLSGYLVQLDSVMMGVVGSRADRTLVLRSSLDNYQANLGAVSFSTTAVNRTMSFATPLSFSGPVTFRFVTLGATNNGNTFSLTNRLNTAGLVFNGTVTPAAVPEPTATFLLTLAGITTAGVGVWRRRRTNSA